MEVRRIEGCNDNNDGDVTVAVSRIDSNEKKMSVFLQVQIACLTMTGDQTHLLRQQSMP